MSHLILITSIWTDNTFASVVKHNCKFNIKALFIDVNMNLFLGM